MTSSSLPSVPLFKQEQGAHERVAKRGYRTDTTFTISPVVSTVNYVDSPGLLDRIAATPPRVNGGRLGKLRLPTNWSRLAYNVEASDFNYFVSANPISKVNHVGFGLHANHFGVQLPFASYGVDGRSAFNVDQNLYNRIASEIRVKMGEADTFNALSTLGEMRNGMRQLAELFARITRILIAAKRGDMKRAFALAGLRGYQVRNSKFQSKAWADHWLQLQYGLLPLMGDIAGARETLQRDLQKNDDILMSVTHKGVTDLSPLWFMSSKHLLFNTNVDGRAFHGVQFEYFYKVLDSAKHFFASIGFFNILPTVWELVGFSFVVDWLVPIGTFLSALQSFVGIEYVAGYVTKVQSANLVFTYPKAINSGKPQTIKLKNMVMQRIPLGAPVSAGLYYKSPFSSTHAANALALFTALHK